jgi:hypothetical protein
MAGAVPVELAEVTVTARVLARSCPDERSGSDYPVMEFHDSKETS